MIPLSEQRIAQSWLAKQNSQLRRGTVFGNFVPDNFVVLNAKYWSYYIHRLICTNPSLWYGVKKTKGSLYELVLYACDANIICYKLGIKLENVICE